MIIIKGNDEAALAARIEKELSGEDITIFHSDDTELTTQQLMEYMVENMKRERVYVGRIERNTRRLEEDVREMNDLLFPISLYFTALLEGVYPKNLLPIKLQHLLSKRENHMRAEENSEVRMNLETQREIAAKLEAEGKRPKE